MTVGGGIRLNDATDNSNDWTVRYNPNTATLTLNEATITGSSDSSVSKGAGIYALCYSEKPVSLTIELIGTNTITGSYGIYVEAQQGGTVGTNASLLIQNSGNGGSLEVSGSSYGIYVKSGTGNASLTINNASVVASSSFSFVDSAGVCVQSGSDATSSPRLSLAVNGGSLTASGGTDRDGIKFCVGAYEATSATTSLTVTPGISAGISGTAFDTAEKVRAELARVLVQDAAYTAENTAFYDVKLQYSLDDGKTWVEATEASFPAEGITVTLPYTQGTGKDTHNFRVVHMFTETSARLGTTAGQTETPGVTKTDSGLQVTLKGLSPVVIGWSKIAPQTTATPAPATTSPADTTTYYTCPACGTHNWTATDNGYRCDNCGYLESVKQLSGYGNVKGTYTPGSNSSSAAAAGAVSAPPTGDTSNPVLWTVVLAAACLTLGVATWAKRRQD